MVKSPQQTLDVPSNSGGYVVREVIRFAFFVHSPHRLIADSVNQVVASLLDKFPPPAISTFAANSGDWITYGTKELKRQTFKRLIGRDSPINASLSLAGEQANIADASIEYKGLAVDLPMYSHACCALWFQLAGSLAPAGLDETLAWLLPIAEQLDCTSAYAEIALEGHQPRMQAAAKRYIADDISDVSCVARDLDLKAPGVYWINYFGPELVSRMKGADCAYRIVSAGVSDATTNGGGRVISFGPVPELGDVAKPDEMKQRKLFAKKLHAARLLHVPVKVTYFEPEEDLDDVRAQGRWHLRLATD